MMSLPEKHGGGPAPSLVTASKISKARIFLSWGGEIFGPATPEEVANGIRTSWFEQSALYWHEGLEEWKPVYEFAISGDQPMDWSNRKLAKAPSAPDLPAASIREKRSAGGRRKPKKSQRQSRKLGRRGRVIFFGIALLAVLLTVAILLLLMQV
jgi:hypothetical protein